MSDPLDWWEAVLLGVVEGITEFLPISSTGHLTFTEALLGHEIDAPDVTAFTAIVQIGAILAAVIYFRHDLWRIVRALIRGAGDREHRSGPDWRLAVAVVVGSIPIGIAGLVFKDQIETTFRDLWVVGAALILWSGVMYYADTRGTLERGEGSVSTRDTLIIGLVQCLALIPGVSRSGATMSAALLLGIDRVTATRFSFFLAIPALAAATALESVSEFDNIANGVGWGPTIAATVVSFFVGYAAIAWLLRYVAHHTFRLFVVYRVALGVGILALLAAGAISAS